MKRLGLWSVSVAGLLLATACREQQPAARAGTQVAADTTAVCDAHVRRVVDRFGARFKLVSLLGQDSIVRRSLHTAYSPFVTPELLAQWEAHPSTAPGREVSNPWPSRIAIRSMQADGEACVVEGDVVYVATGDTAAIIELRPIMLRLQQRDGWRISAYQSTHQQASPRR